MILDVVFAIITIICAVWGAKKGFVQSVCNVFSFIISLAVAFISYDYVSGFVTASPVGEFITEKISGTISVPTVDLSTLPELLRKPLEATLQVTDGSVNTLVQNLSAVIIGAISVIITIILVKIAVKLLFKLFDVVSKLPVIRQCNGILGGIFGVVSGCFWVCILSVLITYLNLIPSMDFLKEFSVGSYGLETVMNNETIISLLPFIGK